MTEQDSLPPFHFNEQGYDSHEDRRNSPFPAVQKRPFSYFAQPPQPPAKPKKGALVPPVGKKSAHISAVNHQKLTLLAGLPSLGGVALGNLLDNILTAYFEDYSPEINRELRKLRGLIPRTDTEVFTSES
jgi:hypothetical protein